VEDSLDRWTGEDAAAAAAAAFWRSSSVCRWYAEKLPYSRRVSRYQSDVGMK